MESVSDLRTQFVIKSTSYVTGMARCDIVLSVDGSMELKGNFNGKKVDFLYLIQVGEGNVSLNESLRHGYVEIWMI